MNHLWPVGPLSEVADVFMGQSPDGSSTNNTGKGTPLLNGPTEFGQFHPDPIQWTSAGARFAISDDVLFCVRGSTTGRMNTADQKYAIGRGLCAIRAKSNSDSKFVRYALAHSLPGLLSAVTGSVFPNLSKPQISDHSIFIPPPSERARISAVLGALDDKIEANVKLASIADEWVRAEYNMLVSRTDERRTVAEIVVHSRNAANPELLAAHVPYVGLEHIPRRSMWLKEHGNSADVSSNKSHFNSGDILFGKLRPYFHKIVTAPTAGICSTDVLVLTPMDDALSGFALASLSDDSVVQAVTAASEGTRMPRTSWKFLSTIYIPWPGHEAATTFSSKVSTIRNYVIGVLAENQSLAATRDALLPQLMSGKLRVKSAEALVESVV